MDVTFGEYRKRVFKLSVFFLGLCGILKAEFGFLESGGLVCIEAEHYNMVEARSDAVYPNNWTVQKSITDHTGDGYVIFPENTIPNNTSGVYTESGRLTYEIEFSTIGTYTIYLRKYATNGGDNSVWVGLDGIPQIENDNGYEYNQWTWINFGQVDITLVGSKTFDIVRREDGYSVDRIVLTTGTAPTGTGPAESTLACLNTAPEIQGISALLALKGKPVQFDIAVSDDGKPFQEGCSPSNPDDGTPYPPEYRWFQQTGSGTASFMPVSADIEDITVTFPLRGTYEVVVEVADAPAGMSGRRTSQHLITVEVIDTLGGDIDINGAVNLQDLILLCNQWLSYCTPGPFCSDLDASGLVTLEDYSQVASQWMTGRNDILINEFVASNRLSYPDGDGNYPDWIELYNPSIDPIVLDGWHLTDNMNNLQKWHFPENVILPGQGYLVVFASSQSVDNYVDSGGFLHTNFALDKDGGYLALVSPIGQIVHEYADYLPQKSDISYGYWYDLYRYFSTPTPMQPNSDEFLGFTDKPNFTHVRGFYDQPFGLEMSSVMPETTLRYTLDGSEPTEQSGMIYDLNTPIAITTTTVVRAAAFRPGYRPGDTKTATFIFPDYVVQQPSDPPGWPDNWGYEPKAKGFEIPEIVADYEMDPRVVNNTIPRYSVREALLDIPTVSIAMLPEDFITDNEINGIYSNPNQRWERKCSIEYILPDGSKGFQEDCKIETHGNASRTPQRMQKHSLRLTFTSEYGTSKLEYPLFDGSGIDEFNQLVLRACFTDSWGLVSWQESRYRPNDSQLIRDVWMKESLADMGQPSSTGNFAHVYVNGLYFGVFNLTERLADDFFADHLGGQEEDWEVNENLVMGDQCPWWLQMMSVDPSTLSGYTQMQSYLDVENFADYMLLHFYADAEDWPQANGYAAVNPVSGDGQYRFFVWDQEIVLDYHGRAAGEINDGRGAGAVFQKMRTSEEFRLLFADRVYKHCFNSGALSVTNSQERYMAIADMIDKAIVAESARWGDTAMSTPYGSTISQPSPLDDINHILYPPAPHGPDYYFTRENSWVIERDNVVNNYFPAIHDTKNSYAIINLLRSNNLYPNINPPIFNINAAYQHGGYADVGDMLTMDNPDSTGTIYYTLDGSNPRLPGGAVNSTASVFETDDPVYSTTVLVEMNDAVWKYLYDGSDQGTGWRTYGFNDNSWGSGPGELGFGDGDEQTNIGPKVGGRMSAYFRHKFTAADVADMDELTINLVYDDGAVIYINNQEVARVNMPSGIVYYDTPSVDGIGDNAVTMLTGITPSVLIEGQNILAVEMHQVNTTSSDISFDLRLNAKELIGPGSEMTETLTRSTHVKARIKDGSTWSALNEAVYAVGPVKENLRITEIMYHPADPNAEFMELQNISTTESINLNLVRFTKGVDFMFSDMTLNPQQYTLIVQDQTAFQTRYPSVPLNAISGQYTGRLDNAGDRIKYQDAAGAAIQNFKYEDNWYELTDGSGFSLTIVDPASTDPNVWDSKTGWRSSLSEGGTPGYSGQTALAAGSIFINELLAHSHLSDPDWIELYNTTAQGIDIGGWFLSDDDSDPNMIRKYQIPAGTIIPANGYTVFYEDMSFGSLSQPAEKRFGLSEGGETVYLYSGNNGDITGYYQTQQKFDASESNVSLGRYEKPTLSGGYDFTRMESITDFSPNTNSAPLVPDVVITEIYYNPPNGTDYEFLELYNRSTLPVTLVSMADTEISPGNVIAEQIGWRLEGTGYEFSSTTPVTIPAGQYIIIAKDPIRYVGLSCPVYGPYDGKLDNGGEEIELQIPGDQEYGKSRYWIPIEKIDYDDAAPWYSSADGGGDSLHRSNKDAYGRDYANWNANPPNPGQL